MGVIDLYPKETVAPTDSPTYSTIIIPFVLLNTHIISQSITTNNNTQTANPTTPINTGSLPYTDEILMIIIGSLALATLMVVTVILRKRKQTN